MILHVARTFHVVRRIGTALELVEHGAVRLAHDVGQHVQAAAVGHAENDLFEPFLAAALDDLLERRDQRFAAVETEALGALVLDVDELLEPFGLDQLLQDRLLALGREVDGLARPFDARLDPAFDLRIGDMHELDAERRAIGPLENLDDLAHRGVIHAEHVIEEDLAVHVLRAEAVIGGGQLVIVVHGAAMPSGSSLA